MWRQSIQTPSLLHWWVFPKPPDKSDGRFIKQASVAWTHRKVELREGNLLPNQRLLWSEDITVRPALILKSGLCHVICIVSIFRFWVMKHHYVMSKISCVFGGPCVLAARALSKQLLSFHMVLFY